ncbi:MAG: Asp-tRNA(Asn)/Glu-tRNA(Gln) amidotransferase subunit GatC [Synechococcales cyanobacterium RU_4_20]|nr:Asp-tRNA(Asn)/Glu-tRNA(Gln) amidotransferase subunit GatC [Synechococcales cyanobacterium RU_4_20]
MLDKDQVHRVAHLARLELQPQEEVQFARQLSSIIDYFEQLSELDTNNVVPTTRAIEVSNVTRVDSLQPALNREQLLECAPDREGDFFRVPKILGES